MLPLEVVLMIASNLDKQEQIYQFALVNRQTFHYLTDFLLQHNIKNRESNALAWAANAGHMSLARRLLTLGADVNTYKGFSNWSSPLHYAATTGRLSMVQLLLSKDASPLVIDRFGNRPILLAMMKGHEKIAKLLFEAAKDADVSCGNTLLNRTPLNTAMHMVPDKLCTSYNPCKTPRNEDVQNPTPLHAACYYRLPRLVSFLLEAGVNVNAAVIRDVTPLHLILATGDSHSHADIDLEIVLLLLRYGASTGLRMRRSCDSPTRGQTARELARYNLDDRIKDLFSYNSAYIRRNESSSIIDNYGTSSCLASGYHYLPMPGDKWT